MAPNETSVLLNNYRTQRYSSDCNSSKTGSGCHAVDDNNHIVYVNKDISEYEPIFCFNDYSFSLTLDELLPYKIDPWWQNLRRILLFAFWLFVLLTFSTACVLSYLRAGQNSCGILEKQISSNSIGISPSSSNSILTATTTFPLTIANVLSTDLLADCCRETEQQQEITEYCTCKSPPPLSLLGPTLETNGIKIFNSISKCK